MSAVLTVSGLGGGYGETQVLRDFSCQVARGEVLGVLGRNGVGKTTLMRLLSGSLPAMTGMVHINDRDLTRLPSYARARAGLSYMPQENVIFDDLTVRENLTLMEPDMARYTALIETFPIIGKRLTQKAGTLSGGEKKIVSFARVIAEARPLALLDEPSEGVQHENLERMAKHIADRCHQGAAFLVVEQNLSFLMQVMRQVKVLDHGETVLSGRDLHRDQMEKHLKV